MTEPILSDPSDAAADRRALRWVVLATLALSGYMLAWSIGTLPVLGDEAQHIRRVQVYFQTGFPRHRITHDPAYPPKGFSSIRYYDTCLWHMALATLWRVLGEPSFVAAQVYHVIYFFAFAVFSYLTGRRFYGRVGGLWAWALAVTTPMNLLFGMLFYLEIPALAFAMATVYFLVRERPILMGVALAGLVLTKATTATVLAPPLVAAALLTMGPTFRRRLLRTGLMAAVCVAVMLPDMLWRYEHFGVLFMLRDWTRGIGFSLTYDIGPPKQTAIPFDILDPVVDLQMFGITGILATVAGILVAVGLVGRGLRAVWCEVRSRGLRAALASLPALLNDKRLILVLPLFFYDAAFVVMLRRAYDVRYFQPTILFTGVLTAGLLARWRPLAWARRGRWPVRAAAWLLLLTMAGQDLAVPPYVHFRRAVPSEVLTAFDWIRRHTPEKARFLYLEANLVTLTGRPLIWAAAMPRYLFTVPEREQVRVLYNLGVEYIAIHPTRRCDSVSRDFEPTAYPRPWVASLASRPYLIRVYPEGNLEDTEGRFLIYRVDASKMPKEWTQGGHPEVSNPFWSGTSPDEPPAAP